MAALSRSAIEIPLSSGLTLRGAHLRGGDGQGDVIVFVHDLDRDLDEFGSLPDAMAALGCDVVLFDLPGHGLSDGDDGEPPGCAAAIREVLSRYGGRRIGLVVSGRPATVAASLGDRDGVVAQVLISPILDPAFDDGSVRAHAVRMVLHGDGPKMVGTATQRFFSRLIGEKMLVFNSSLAEGPHMVTVVSTVQAHVELFFKRYLIRSN